DEPLANAASRPRRLKPTPTLGQQLVGIGFSRCVRSAGFRTFETPSFKEGKTPGRNRSHKNRAKCEHPSLTDHAAWASAFCFDFTILFSEVRYHVGDNVTNLFGRHPDHRSNRVVKRLRNPTHLKGCFAGRF